MHCVYRRFVVALTADMALHEALLVRYCLSTRTENTAVMQASEQHHIMLLWGSSTYLLKASNGKQNCTAVL